MTAIYYQLLTGVASQMSALAGIPTVVTRKKLVLVQGDPSRLVIVALGRGGEKTDRLTFRSATTGNQTGVNYLYPVAVAYIEPANAILTQGIAANLQMRENIRNALYVAAPGFIVAPGYDVEIDPDEPFDFGAFTATNYDVTGFRMTYRVSEGMQH